LETFENFGPPLLSFDELFDKRLIVLVKKDFDSKLVTNMTYVKKMEKIALSQCEDCDTWYYGYCYRCTCPKREKACHTQAEKVKNPSSFLFEKVKYVKKEDEFLVRFTYDFETYTDDDDALRIYAVGVIIDCFQFSKNSGRLFVDISLFKKEIDEIFKQFQQASPSEHIQHCHFVYFQYVKPGRFSFIQKDIVEAQKKLLRFFLETLSIGSDTLRLVSSTFNGSKFDELFLIGHRVYYEMLIEEHLLPLQYIVKNGSVIYLSSAEKQTKGERKIQTFISLHDVCRFWTTSLDKAAKSCGLPILKGFIDHTWISMNYVTQTFNMDAIPLHIFKSELESMRELDEKYVEGEFVNLTRAIIDYCINDVVVTVLLDDCMCDQINSCSFDLVESYLNIWNRVGTPAVTRDIFLMHAMKKNIELHAPQQAVYDLIQKTVIGGRSHVSCVGHYRSPTPDADIINVDINSMYSNCMTAPFPIGTGIPFTDDRIEDMELFFEICKNVGWRKSIDDEMPDYASCNFAFFFAKLVAPNESKLLSLAPLAVRDSKSTSLIWSNESRDAQAVTFIDAMILALMGWRVTICRDRPKLLFVQSTTVLRELVTYYATKRKQTDNAALKIVLKLLSNALYGKMLEKFNVQSHQIVVDEHFDDVKSSKIKTRTKVLTNSKFSCEIQSSVTIPNPYQGDRSGLSIVSVKNTDIVKGNRTMNHWGSMVLAYSRLMYWDLIMMAHGRDVHVPRPLKERRMILTAAETDSAHLLRWAFDNLPSAMLDDKEVGGYDETLNMFRYYLKVEEFDDNTKCETKEAYYISKKFYFLVNPNDETHSKYACKGISKATLNKPILHRVVSSTFYDGEEHRFVNMDPVHLSADVLRRNVPGVRNNFEVECALMSAKLSRQVNISHNGMRCHDKTNSGMTDLSTGIIWVLPYDDRHCYSDGYEPPVKYAIGTLLLPV
jgi:hypothetical protein